MRKNLWMTMLAMLLYAVPAQAAGLQVQGAWVRLPPPVSDTAALYAVFRNPGAQAVRIVGVSADVAAKAMLHTMAGGRMQALPSLEIPAGGERRLAPGGMHIMLMGLRHPLAAGETVHVTLRHADGSQQHTDAVVRDARGDAGAMGSMGGMHETDGMGGVGHAH